MKTWLWLAAGLTTAALTWGASHFVASETAQLPPDVIQCELGDLAPGANVSRVIRIENPTKSPLTIRSLHADCACVSKEMDRDVIPAGGAANLKVAYRTTPAPGAISHRIDISYVEVNAPTTVWIKGVVAGWIIEPPADVDFGNVLPGVTVERQICLETKDSWPISEREVELRLEQAAIRPQAAPVAPRRFCSVLSFSPPIDAECRDYRGELHIQWKGHVERTIRIPCIARVVPPWTPSPATALFGIVPSGTTKRVEIRLHRIKESSAARAADLRVTHNLESILDVGLTVASEDDALLSIAYKGGSAGDKPGVFEERIQIIDSAGRVLTVIPVLAFRP